LLEKRWYAVTPQLITTDGSANGYVTILNACVVLKVKQLINITDTLGNFRTYEVKRVDEPNIVYLGPVGKPITCYDDLSIYTVANGSFLFADEQQRSKVPEEQIPRAVYQEEPTVAIRSILVDSCGIAIGPLNPLPVDAVLNVSSLSIDLDAKTGDNVAISSHPSQIFSEYANTLDIAGFKEVFSYTSLSSLTRVVSIVVAVSTTANIKLKINGVVKREYRTSPMDRQAQIEFKEHRPLPSGAIITVEVEAERFIRPQYLTFTSLEGYLA
jgi:hypothetical protein